MNQGFRFQVNREKMREGNMQRDQAAAHWETIHDAIYKIQNKQASTLSYEELYRTAYNLVLHKHGSMLYNNVMQTTADLLKPIADQLVLQPDDVLLSKINRQWADQKLCIIMIKDILLYMNKNYVPKEKLKPVEQMLYSQFKHHVVLCPTLKQKLVEQLIHDIRCERNNQVIERSQVRLAVQMLIEVGVHSRKIYEDEFEKFLLTDTADYYRAESQKLISEVDCGSYLTSANDRLVQELDRVQSYLTPSSEEKLIEKLLDEYIGDSHAQTLLKMENSGLVHMIRNNKLSELTLLFNLFQRRPQSFQLLKVCFAEYIVDEGSKLVTDSANMKTDEFVNKLMKLREVIYDIAQRAMGRDTQVDLAVKIAFEKVCNQEQKVAKALVGYLDEMFKNEFKTMSEDQMQLKIDAIIQIFRFLEDKDVFEGFYKNSFAKRLLEQRQINEEAERALLVKLKEECGVNFTQRLEVMYRDIKNSEEMGREFSNSAAYRQLEGVELQVKVLTTGHWPNDQKEQIQSLVNLPRELSIAMTCYSQFYYNKFNNGRQLNWKLSQGNAEVRANFQQNQSRNYEFYCSTYQMFIMLLFNQNAELSYTQVCQLTQISVQELSLHLIPLIKMKVILKTPDARTFQPEDRLAPNLNYTANLIRVKIPVFVSKQNKDNDNIRVASKVDDDRRYAVEASVVKVMKARRTITHSELVSETTKILLIKFKPDPVQVKQRIETLIERGYIERDTDDKRIYKYIA